MDLICRNRRFDFDLLKSQLKNVRVNQGTDLVKFFDQKILFIAFKFFFLDGAELGLEQFVALYT